MLHGIMHNTVDSLVAVALQAQVDGSLWRTSLRGGDSCSSASPGPSGQLLQHAANVNPLGLTTSHVMLQAELDFALKEYVGRETPLYFAERLSEHYRR
jgi:hypothetical protein